MFVVTVGGGPAGLYNALLLKKARPNYKISVLERNKAGDTFGWGVVFSDQTLGNFKLADEPTYQEIINNFAHWDDIDVHFKGTTITSSGHGFCGIARKKLLEILANRAIELGVDVRFEKDIPSLSALDPVGMGDADLIIAADGVNSRIRTELSDAFKPTVDKRSARYVWFGTTLPFDAFTFCIIENEWGVFQAHCYRFDEGLSTFIVECDEQSWKNAGFENTNTDQTIAICEEMFAKWLQGHRLLSNAAHRQNSPWTNFLRITNERWYTNSPWGKVVLIGDAAHTAHFSIGSGTKLAMEDAIALSTAISSDESLDQSLQKYQDERSIEALKIQNAARNSMEWFEQIKRYTRLEPTQFAYSLLTRSQRVSHENLRLRDSAYLEGVERWFASKASESEAESHIQSDTSPPPPLFTPYRMRGMHLVNRIAVAPMDMYRAVDGVPTDFHLVHLGGRAVGGAGLIFTEMTCVSSTGRITPGCTGLYNDEQTASWKRIVDFVHGESKAKIALQLGHSGRKGSTKVPWLGNNVPLTEGSWGTLAPSPIPYAPHMPAPREITREEMDLIRDEFVEAAKRAIEADFDMLELHCAHGYLLSSFITPISNRRNDEYGGSLENRMRYPLEVFNAIRSAWPAERPMSVRISATDWAAGGLSNEEAVAISRAFIDAGADIIHVSTGQTTVEEQPVYGRMYQTPFSDMIRNEAGVPTIAVGNIQEPDQVNSIIAAGRADLCAIGRPHLANPYWTLHAAAQLNHPQQHWTHSYYLGKLQLEREAARQKELQAALQAQLQQFVSVKPQHSSTETN